MNTRIFDLLLSSLKLLENAGKQYSLQTQKLSFYYMNKPIQMVELQTKHRAKDNAV